MYNLIIDIGNSNCKIAWFKSSRLLSVSSYAINKIDFACIQQQWNEYKPNAAIICSVLTKIPLPLHKIVKKIRYVITFNSTTPLPIINGYKSPTTLGLDRLANTVGLTKVCSSLPALSIDLGTCIKFDLLLKNKRYVGGSISPGLSMRFKALHAFTDQLPLIVAEKKHIALTGTNTEESITAGVLNGMFGEIKYLIEKYQEQYPDVTIVLTGGDQRFFAHKLKKTIFVAQNLTLVGLNEILEFNLPYSTNK